VVRFVQISLKDEGLNPDVIPGDAIRCHHGKQKQEVRLPKVVSQFTEEFNAGKYPELELPPDASRSSASVDVVSSRADNRLRP
jgi:hypothetical protein